VSVADDLRRLLGDDGLQTLIAAKGGARLPIPSAPTPGHELAELLGYPAFARLCAEYGGDSPDIPLLDQSRARRIDRDVLDALSAGHSADWIAPRYGISRRTVYRIQARARASQA
jgi:hypothetical protein